MWCLKPSKFAQKAFIILAGMVLILVWGLPDALSIKLVATLLLAMASKVYRMKAYALAGIKLQKLNDKLWEIQLNNGKNLLGELAHNSFCSDIFSVLVLKNGKHFHRKKIIIFKDSLAKDDYHQLRLSMRGLI